MAKDVKFGYFYGGNSLTSILMEFDRGYLKEEGKFIQIRINEKDYIRVGHSNHKNILEGTLNEFGIKFNTRKNKESIDIPLEFGDNYDLVGAGKIRFYGEKLNFYDTSGDYANHVGGADGQNLENIFGENNVTQVEGDIEPSFLVKIPQQ